MSPLDFVWLFFIALALQPLLRQKLLETARQRRLLEMEQSRGSRVILLVHRQETMRLLGFPLMRYIDIHDSEAVLRAIHETDPDLPLDLVLHTPGGLVLASIQIARALAAHRGRVTVFVPHHAMSGGTLLALAADEIVLCPHAVLGPVDPQIGEYPAASVLRASARKGVDSVDDATLILADQARMALTELDAVIRHLVAPRAGEAEAAELAGVLTQGHWTHDYPISVDEARGLGLPVSTAMPEGVTELMTLYPPPSQSGAVEYLPGHHGPVRRAP